MSERNRYKFTKALKSGEYKQTKNKLKRVINGETCYCAMGVLCEVYRIDTGKGEWTRMGFRLDNITANERPHYKILSWAGISEFTSARIEQNNDEGLTFKEIAESIII